ncbi:MAG TPA: hypothetical protein VEH05_02995 [Streptosporangiaceae bacterium]|nr:hypothetical protein [Streptosporangiaceae bacterium]
MNASPAARRVAFAAIVCGFAALGGYLLGPAAHHGGTASRPAAAARSPRPAAPAGQRAARASSAAPDIYQWLPFTQSGLAAAAATAIRFGAAYGTYTYTEDPAEYAASLQPVTSAQLVGQIEAAYSAPGVAATRQSQQQVAVGTAEIGSLRAFGPGSLTFVLQVTQQVTGTTGDSEQVADYAVTVSGAGTSWQVTDVELAAAGNS